MISRAVMLQGQGKVQVINISGMIVCWDSCAHSTRLQNADERGRDWLMELNVDHGWLQKEFRQQTNENCVRARKLLF
jgi:hypothetical protein